jgi:hypothetical protein
MSYFMPMPSSVASSISRNSMGTRLMVIEDSVTTAAASRLMASMGSSEGEYSTSTSMVRRPRTVSVVVPMPSISTPSSWRKKQRSWTM